MSTLTPAMAPDPRDWRARLSSALTALRSRVEPTIALAVALPLLTLVAIGLTYPDTVTDRAAAAVRTPLSSATLVCASPLKPERRVQLSTTQSGAEGTVQVRKGREYVDLPLAADEVSVIGAPGPVTVTGRGDLAPGLLGSRFDRDEKAGVVCAPPSPDLWFTGLGAGARRVSVLELVNPDAGRAIADITVYSRSGVLDVPALRGVTVSGRSHVDLDLSAIVPTRGELAVHVVTSRGRLATTVLDRYDELGAGPTSVDWLPAQADARRSNFLVGLARGKQSRQLVIANPGEDEVRIKVKVLSYQSLFTPEGLDEIRLAPGTVTSLQVRGVLAKALRDAIGLQVLSTGPVTAALRSFGRDLSYAVPGRGLTEPTRVVVPTGPKTVYLAGATAPGSVTVIGWSRDGRLLEKQRFKVTPGQGYSVDLPGGVDLVEVTPTDAKVVGVVMASGGGTAVLPLTPLLRNGLVPTVWPGLP